MILAILLACVGLVCLYFEFFLPGGILAVFGGILLISGGVLFYYSSTTLLFLVLYIVTVVLLGIGVCAFALNRIRRSAPNDTFFLKNDQEGYVAAEIDPKVVGKEGVTETELKPAGFVRVEGICYQAVSEGGFVSKGIQIKVLSGKGSHLVVTSIKKG